MILTKHHGSAAAGLIIESICVASLTLLGRLAREASDSYNVHSLDEGLQLLGTAARTECESSKSNEAPQDKH